MQLAIRFDDVAQAAQRLHGVAHRTPVLTSRHADELTGARVFFKCENFQRMGAFKFRGAFNALSQFTPEQRKAGAIAFSSGNHAQAVALSARLLGMPVGHRHAAGRAAGQAGRHARLPAGRRRQRGDPVRPLQRGPRGADAGASPPSAA